MTSQEPQGMKRVALESFIVMIFVMLVYLIAYEFMGRGETSFNVLRLVVFVPLIATFAIVAATFFTALAAATFALAFSFLFITLVIPASVVTTFISVLTGFASFAVGFLIYSCLAANYKVETWQVMLLFLVEVGLLFAAFKVWTPYLAIALLVATVIATIVVRILPSQEKKDAVPSK